MDKIPKEDTVILDIGCGQEKMPNSIGVGIIKTKGADVIADMKQLPAEDQSADKILCLQLLRHVDGSIKAIEENHRVLNREGKVVIEVPHIVWVLESEMDS